MAAPPAPAQRRHRCPPDPAPTIVLLGTNHVAGWLDGVGAWDLGAWRTPLGDVEIDVGLAAADRRARAALRRRPPRPQRRALDRGPAAVPPAGRAGRPDRPAGGRRRDRCRRHRGRPPAGRAPRRATPRPATRSSSRSARTWPTTRRPGRAPRTIDALLPAIVALDPVGLARTEAGLRQAGIHGLLVRDVRHRADRRSGSRRSRAMGARTGDPARRGDLGRRRWPAGANGRLPGGRVRGLTVCAPRGSGGPDGRRAEAVGCRPVDRPAETEGPARERDARHDAIRGRDADRLVPLRDRPADRARPRRDRRPHRLANGRPAARRRPRPVRDRPARSRRERRHGALCDRPRVRGRGGGHRCGRGGGGRSGRCGRPLVRRPGRARRGPPDPEPAPARRVRGRTGAGRRLIPRRRGHGPPRSARGCRRRGRAAGRLPRQRRRDVAGGARRVPRLADLAGPGRGRAHGDPRDVGGGRRGRRPGALRRDPDPRPPDRRGREQRALHRRDVGARPAARERRGSSSSRARGMPPTTPIRRRSSRRSASSSTGNYHSTMPDATAPTAPPAPTPGPSPADDRPYSPGLEGVIGAESAIGLVDGKNGRLLYRGYPIGQLVARGTYAEVADLLWTGEWHPGRGAAPRSAARGGPRRPPRIAARRPPDGRAADRGLGLGRRPGDRLAADARAGPRPDGVLAHGARRVRPDPARPRPDPARPKPRPRRRIPPPAHRPGARPGHVTGARGVLHRRRGARAQRVDVHRPGDHRDPVRPRLGRDRGDRGAQGAAPRRRPGRGGQPAPRDRLGRAR